MSEQEKILIKDCKADFLRNLLNWRQIWLKDNNRVEAYNRMARYACLVDLMTRLENSTKGNKP